MKTEHDLMIIKLRNMQRRNAQQREELAEEQRVTDALLKAATTKEYVDPYG